jgi:DNA repair protein RecO (recombination protein O)
MALTRCEAIVVRTYPLGDTSRIAVLYSREFGLVRGVAKGARAAKSRFGGSLEPLTRLDAVLYRKDGRDLDLLSKLDVLETWTAADLLRTTHAQAVLEFVDRLVWESEHDPHLYDLVRTALDALRVAPEGTLSSITAAFQLHAASLLGYQPRFDACASCGGAAAARFAPARGGVVCERCAEGETLCVAASAEALAALARLLATPLPALVPFSSARAGEMLRLVELHLKSHFHRFAGFRSLAMLLALEGAAA